MKKSHVVDHIFDNFELNEKGGSDQKVKGRLFFANSKAAKLDASVQQKRNWNLTKSTSPVINM
jgi:hypothetical protein